MFNFDIEYIRTFSIVFSAKNSDYEIEFQLESELCNIDKTLMKVPDNSTDIYLSTSATLRFVGNNFIVKTFELKNINRKIINNQLILFNKHVNIIFNKTTLNMDIYESYFKLTKLKTDNIDLNFENKQNSDNEPKFDDVNSSSSNTKEDSGESFVDLEETNNQN